MTQRDSALKEKQSRDFITRLAAELSAAWLIYLEAFGEVPHGTEKQMAALLELVPNKFFLSKRRAKGAKR